MSRDINQILKEVQIISEMYKKSRDKSEDSGNENTEAGNGEEKGAFGKELAKATNYQAPEAKDFFAKN
jgi:hypothetical protein